MKLLELLERDWALKMTPKVPSNKVPIISQARDYKVFGDETTTFSKLQDAKQKKIFTDALVQWLHDTGHMMRYLQGDVGEFEVVKTNKDRKGNVTSIEIDIPKKTTL